MRNNKDEVEQLIKELMLANCKYNYSWKWDKRLSRWGSCNQRTKQLTFSEPLFLSNDIKQARHTILHEIAHANVGAGKGHGKVWQRECVRLGIKASTYHPHDNALVTPGAKFIGKCPAGHISYRMRKTSSMGKSSCGVCCSSYNPKYIVKWQAVV